MARDAAWGQHLVVDASSGDLNAVRDPEAIRVFVRTLVAEIGMRAYGPPILEHFATEDAKAAGYSLVQLIETSSITGHFVDATGDFYLDIFSCRSFNNETALAVVETTFRPSAVKTTVLHRQAP